MHAGEVRNGFKIRYFNENIDEVQIYFKVSEQKLYNINNSEYEN